MLKSSDDGPGSVSKCPIERDVQNLCLPKLKEVLSLRVAVGWRKPPASIGGWRMLLGKASILRIV